MPPQSPALMPMPPLTPAQANPPPPAQYQGFNPALLGSIPPGLLNRFGNYQMQSYNPAMQAQGLLQSLGQLQTAPQQLLGAFGPPITPASGAGQGMGGVQPNPYGPGAGYGGQGDAGARGGYRNDRMPSEGMLNAMEGLGSWNPLGLAARGLAGMARGAGAGTDGGRAGATDRSGQVRGGGTGARGGGLTAGGPR